MLHSIIKPLVSLCMILQFFFSQAIDEKDVHNAINTFMTFVVFPDDIEDGNKETEEAFREILYDMLHKKPKCKDFCEVAYRLMLKIYTDNNVAFEDLIKILMDHVVFLDDIADNNRKTEEAFRKILNDMLDKKPRLKDMSAAASQLRSEINTDKPVTFENLINILMESVVFPDDIAYNNRKTEEAFRKILNDMRHKKPRLKHKEISSVGYKLISEINEILYDSKPVRFEDLIEELNEYNGLIDVERVRSCTYQYKMKDLIKELNKFDESVFVHDINKKYIEFINLRNASIRKKIKIYCTDLYGNNEGNAPSFYMPLTHKEYMKINFRSLECPNIIIIDKNQNVKGSISPAKVGLFHELLHLYHYIKNPLIVHAFKEDIAYSMITSSYKNAIDDKNCEHIDLILYPKDEQFHISNTDDSLIINLEEFLTIRGKSETTYYLSENSYRLENDEFLRYSIFESSTLPGIDNVSKSLYDRYHIVASTSKRRGL